MTIRGRLLSAMLALSVLEAGECVRADELAVKKNDAPTKTPTEKPGVEKADAVKGDADKVTGVQKKLDDAKAESPAADQKNNADKKAPAQPLNLKMLAAPLNLLIGGPAVINVEAKADVVVMEAVGVEAAADDPNEAMLQQMLQQVRPVYASELGFTRLMLPDLTVAQRKSIKGPAFLALKEAAKQMVAQQNGQRRGLGRANKSGEPRAMIRQAVAKAVKETVSEEQNTRYEAELTKRIERRKTAAILSLVAMLDQQMFLTVEQRDAITESITAKWQDDWEKWTKMSQMYGDRYFPQVPDNLVVPHLNAEQKTVWKGVQKIEIGWWWGGEQGIDPDADGWWVPDEPVETGKSTKGLPKFRNGILEFFKK